MIKNQIQAVVNQLIVNVNGVDCAPGFLYGTKNELSGFLNNTVLPVVMLYNLKPASEQTTITNAVSDSYDLYMEFIFGPVPLDTQTTQNEDTVQAASNLMQQFLIKLQHYRQTPNEARFFRIKNGTKYKSLPVYNKFDVNCVGVNLTMSLGTMSNQGFDPASRPPGWVAGPFG